MRRLLVDHLIGRSHGMRILRHLSVGRLVAAVVRALVVVVVVGVVIVVVLSLFETVGVGARSAAVVRRKREHPFIKSAST